MSRKKIIGFLIALLTTSWIAQLAVLQLWGTIEEAVPAPYFAIMFLPALFGLGFTFFDPKTRREIEWRPTNIMPFAAALLVPLLLGFAVLALVIVGGIARSDYFTFTAAGVDIAFGPWLLGTGEQSWPLFAANMVVTAALYSVLAGLATIGEEYGWRGVLQNPMIREFGLAPGVALLGFAWGIFHVPVVLAGYNFPDTPVLGAFIFMPLVTIAGSFVMAWLTLWNRSFWPAVIMHGVINSVYGSVILNVAPRDGTMTGVHLINIALYGALGCAAYLLARRFARRPRR